ncbi:hypothetical protein [Sphingomonas crusticola]|uniref:hypothetical protein n=1 Tax=Sphingomonas crusticola TaxID=1697973 RepID=UPI000E272476|nr:hypothetical protein [Sphingomonas crusticola]
MAPPVAAPAAPAASPDSPPSVTEDQLLLLELRFSGHTLSDAMSTYATDQGVYLPLGELSRILEMDIRIDGTRATGTIGAARAPLLLDIAALQLSVGGRTIPVTRNQALVAGGDIYLRQDLLQAVLPIRLELDTSSLAATLTPRERLPFQDSEERRARRAQLSENKGEGGTTADVLNISTPYRAFTAPSIDINADGGFGNSDTPRTTHYDLRAAGDLLWSNYQLYVGSNQNGKPTSVRATLERDDPDGHLLGPLHATRVAVGDIYTPALSIGPRSTFGRGFIISSDPVEQASVFDRIVLRGELPLGYEVELYVNDALRGSQATPVEGRYEFPDISLIRGLNVIRLIFYGPRGERREEVRQINVGSGVLSKGQTVINMGVAQEGRSLFTLEDRAGLSDINSGNGLRAVISVAHGFTPSLTLTAGAARYTTDQGDTSALGAVGLRTSFFGMATQLDAAVNNQGATGAALSLAGQVKGVAVVARHAEYRGGFSDEVLPSGNDELVRSTNVRADITIPIGANLRLPISTELERDQYTDGSTLYQASARSTVNLGGAYFSGGVEYSRRNQVNFADEHLVATLDASTTVRTWQLRAALNLDVVPTLRARTLTLTADRDVSEDLSYRIGIIRSFGSGAATSIQAAGTRHFPFGDVALNGEFRPEAMDYRLSLQFAVGLVYNPARSRYVLTRPGAASSGTVAFHAFVDTNGNGVLDPGEEPVPGIAVEGGSRTTPTGADGRALISNVAGVGRARLQVDLDALADPYLAAPPQTVQLVPGPGRVAAVEYPLRRSGEMQAHVMLLTAAGDKRGLSAAKIEVARPDGSVVMEARTEFDGSVFIERLPVGTYQLQMDAAQMNSLGLVADAPVPFTVSPKGGYVGEVTIMVRLRPKPVSDSSP